MIRLWRCCRCKLPLGRLTRQDDLIITAPSAALERTRRGAVVHCPACGAETAFNGRRVIVDTAKPIPLTRDKLANN